MAIATAMKQILYRPNIKDKIVILVDSKSAIQALNNYQKKNTIIEEIRSTYRILLAQKKTIILQWIPSHIGLFGNDQADYLAKKGTKIKQKPKHKISLNKRLAELKIAMHDSRQEELKSILTGKKYEKIAEFTQKIIRQTRKNFTALFRLETGHDCLNLHLHKIGISTTDKCTLCNSHETMDKNHLLQCRRLDPAKQMRRDLPGLYWEARELMM